MIVRGPKQGRPFTRIDRALLNDHPLSAEALGLLCHLLGRPDRRQLDPDALRDRYGWGVERWRRVLGELLAAGYVTRAHRREGGRFVGVDYVVSDTPLCATGRAVGPDGGAAPKRPGEVAP